MEPMELLGFLPAHQLGLFAMLVAGIIILPGMDMAFVLASTLVGGRRAGFAAVFGLIAGGLAHVGLAVLGVGVMLKAVPQAFPLMLLAGAAYLAWIGWSLLRNAGALGEISTGPLRSFPSTFLRAAATCLVNPKAYLFMLSVFPQFLRPEAGPILPQAVALGLIISAAQLIIYGGVALGADALKTWLSTSAMGQVRLGRAVGLVLIATAAWTASRGLG